MAYFNYFSKFICLSVGVVTLQACSVVDLGPKQSWSAAQNHPISVMQKTEFMFVEVLPGRKALSSADKARLDVFAEQFLVKGDGPITIVAHSGAGKNGNSQALLSDIRTHLHESGVDWSQMTDPSHVVSATLHMREPGDRVVLSFDIYAATATSCRVRSTGLMANYKNMASENFGCASQHNLAAMVADPKDLLRPAAQTPADAQRRDVIIDKYRAGESSAQETSSDLEIQTTSGR